MKRISYEKVAFIIFDLQNGDAKRQKNALQELSALYRKGFVLSSQEKNNIETIINGIMLRQPQDLKVVRWCLNSLAQFGRLANCKIYVEAALKNYIGNPEIEAAGVAALCHFYRGETGSIDYLTQLNPAMWKLAALQNTDPSRIDLNGLKIDIYKDDNELLKLALITIGLNKDIKNLFHPKFDNNEFVKKLGQHDDKIIQQYSVWSVLENNNLNFTDLGVDYNNIETLSPNVQSKALQLIAEKHTEKHAQLDLMARGSVLPSSDAREGLARGLKIQFFDGIEGVTLPWFEQETHQSVRELLAEHMARYASKYRPYQDKVEEAFETSPDLRKQLLLGSEGTPVYSILKSNEAYGQGNSLFSDTEIGKDLIIPLSKQGVKSRNTSKKFRLLFLAVAPKDQINLRLDQEQRDLQQKISNITKKKIIIDIHHGFAVRSDQIQEHLLNKNPDGIHFSGHGDVGELCFEDKDGNTIMVKADDFSNIIDACCPNVKLIVLNACYSETVAKILAKKDRFVVGCDNSINDDAAIAFSQYFYQAISAGKSFDDSFKAAISSIKMDGMHSEAVKYKKT